jgi:TolB-like protein
VEPAAELTHASFSPSPHSIAVLPFSNITGSPDMDYLGDGMSEELIHKLTRVPGFRVPARTSSFAYKGRHANVRDIARDLNVALVIEGSVRTAGEHIRVTAQVIDARSGYHVWSQTYDRQLADIFALQDELASAVVNALQGDGSSLALREIISATPTHDIEAYQLYLQGSALYSQPSATNIRKAIELCNQAIRRDPSFSRAMCKVALAHIVAAGNGWEPWPSALANAEQNADRALAIDPALADARGVLGMVYACRRKWPEAEEYFRAALSVAEINPLTAQTHAIVLLASVGHLREAMREAERAYRIAPALAPVLMVHATLHSLAGNDAEALKYTDFAAAHGWPINVRPFPHIHSVAAVRSGCYSEAVRWTMEVLSAYRRPAELEALVTTVFRAFAQPAVQNEALAAMAKFFAERSEEVVRTMSLPRFLMHWSVVFANLDFAYLVGNRALDHFDAEGAMAVTSFIPHLWIPEFRAFRQDARFRALATRLGLPPYWQRYGPPDAHDTQVTTFGASN